jgi:hypothetical protein
MTKRFRGIVYGKSTLRTVEGSGVLFANGKAYILKAVSPISDAVTKVRVLTNTVGQGVLLENLGNVYVGDVIRYTFKFDEDYYHRYYHLTEDNGSVVLSEIYRDYALDEELKPIRGKFYEHKGEVRNLSTPMTYKEMYDVVGNIWQNPEFEE